MDEKALLNRITFNPNIFGGKPIIRGRRLAVEHVLGMLAAGDEYETILDGYPWLEKEDIQASVCSDIINRYANELQAGGMITVESNRIRIRTASQENK